MAMRWMGVGWRYPRARTPRRRASWTPSWAKAAVWDAARASTFAWRPRRPFERAPFASIASRDPSLCAAKGQIPSFSLLFPFEREPLVGTRTPQNRSIPPFRGPGEPERRWRTWDPIQGSFFSSQVSRRVSPRVRFGSEPQREWVPSERTWRCLRTRGGEGERPDGDRRAAAARGGYSGCSPARPRPTAGGVPPKSPNVQRPKARAFPTLPYERPSILSSRRRAKRCVSTAREKRGRWFFARPDPFAIPPPRLTSRLIRGVGFLSPFAPGFSDRSQADLPLSSTDTPEKPGPIARSALLRTHPRDPRGGRPILLGGARPRDRLRGSRPSPLLSSVPDPSLFLDPVPWASRQAGVGGRGGFAPTTANACSTSIDIAFATTFTLHPASEEGSGIARTSLKGSRSQGSK